MNSAHTLMYIYIFSDRKATNFLVHCESQTSDTSEYGFFNKPCNVSKIRQIERIV